MQAGEATDTNAEAAKKEEATIEAEGRKATDTSAAQAAAAGNESISKREAEATEGTAATAGKTVATDASAAHAAAALDEDVEKRQAAAPEGSAAREDQEMNEKDERIRALMQKRKITAKHEKDQIREINKEIKKYPRKQKDEETGKNSEDIGKGERYKKYTQYQISEEANSLPQSQKQGWRSRKKRGKASQTYLQSFMKICTKEEEEHGDEEMNSCTEQENAEPSQSETIPEFTMEELQAAINRLKKGKARDSSGVRAEQLKICSDDTKEQIRTIFNEITQREDFTPKSWRRIRIQVIHTKGDREDPGNYRPICGLPILYKLFATVLYARLASSLQKIQPPDQAGFRPNHRCEDHLTVYRIL